MMFPWKRSPHIPERPVPVFIPSNEINVLGGAANVARNIVSLGGKCTIVSIVGNDQPSHEIHHLLKSHSNINARLIDCDRATSHKVRFTATGQHLMRLDNDASEPIGEAEIHQVFSAVESLLPSHNLLIISDYAKGLLSPLCSRKLLLARQLEKPVLIDPKSKLSRYAGSSLVTPIK